MLKRFLHHSARLPPQFLFIPEFLSHREQKILLKTAMEQLDAKEPRRYRKRRDLLPPLFEQNSDDIRDYFLPDSYYQFEQGHYDGVIHRFREIHLTAWPQDVPDLPHILDRLYSLLPSKIDTQTHLLHLASTGHILPHVDNLGASGAWIFGVSLGSERILRMQGPSSEDDFDVLLPSGSIYLQRDFLRYQFRHSILEKGTIDGRSLTGGQRLSIMIRDRKSIPSLN